MGQDISRRVVLQVVGAGAAAVGACACSRGPQEFIVPYVDQPPEVTPSVPSHYATVASLDGYGFGVLAESHEGRPTKLEGNPRHPATLGALGAVLQASLFDLYAPGRASGVTNAGMPSTWRALIAAISTPPAPGKQIHLLLEPTSAPHLVELIARARSEREIAVHFDSPMARTEVWAGSRLAFGRVLEPRFDFARAEVVVSLDADFLSTSRNPLVWSRAWASRRRLDGPGGRLSRLYVVEPRMTVTGTSADERLAVQGRSVADVAADLLSELGPAPVDRAPRVAASSWVKALARNLIAHRGASLVLAGDTQPAEVHAMAHALNERLGNVGATVTYGPSPVFEAGAASHGLGPLVQALDEGRVATLIMAGVDPLYTASPDLELARRVASAGRTAYLGERDTRTARACRWTCARAHWLEAWADALAFDGTPAIAQPLVRPLVQGWTVGQLLAALLGEEGATSLDLVRRTWAGRAGAGVEAFWTESLVHGVVPAGATPAVDVRVDPGAIARILASPRVPPAPLEVAFYVDDKVLDGRFGDNPLLQELPDPVTKVTWDSAALVSPATARQLGVDDGRVVSLTVRERVARAPVLIVAGMADDVMALALGYGQSVPGRTSDGVGTDAFALRDSRASWFDDGAVKPLAEHRPFALTQEHSSMEERPIVLRRTLAEYRANPDFARPLDDQPPSLYELAPDAPHQWGMTIDLNACTGCSACVVACMAENNVPVVGRRGVQLGRAMHWLRIDRYVVGDARTRGFAGAAHALPALREGSVRVRLPGQRHRPQPRWAERDGLQPLRRHAVLLQQLPLQGPAVQLLQLQRRQARDPRARREPRCHRPRPRRHGEVHLLRAADPRGRDPRRREQRPIETARS